MTTIDQQMTASDEKYLGDCILHLTYHDMEQECWNAVIEFYADNIEHPMVTSAATKPTDMANQAMVNFYKWEYEQRVLDRFMRTGEL